MRGPRRRSAAISPFSIFRRIAASNISNASSVCPATVQLRGGVVYLNGAPFARERVAGAFRSEWVGNPAIRYIESMPDGRHYRIAKMGDSGWRNDTNEFVVPPDRYFVLGDNRDNS